MTSDSALLIIKPEALDKIDLIMPLLIKKGYVINKYMLIKNFKKYLRHMYEEELNARSISFLEKAYENKKNRWQDWFYIILLSHRLGNTKRRIKQDVGHHSSYQFNDKSTLRGLFGLPSIENITIENFVVHFNGFHTIEGGKVNTFLSKVVEHDILSEDTDFQQDSYPKRVSWIITTKCNLQCKHCYLASSPYLDESVSLEKAYEIIKILRDLNVESVFVSGGEPLIHKHIDKILKISRDHGFSVGLCTNGTLLSKWIRDIKNYVDYLSIGLESINHQKYRYIRGISIEKVIKSIEMAVSYGIDTSIDIMLTKQNIDELNDIFAFASKYNIDSIFLRRFIPLGRGVINRNIFEISREQFKESIKLALELSKKYNVKVHSEDPVFSFLLRTDSKKYNASTYEERFLSGCRAAGISFGIYIDSIYYCPVIAKYRNIGKITDYNLDELKSLLSNSPYKKQVFYQSRCSKCKYFDFCKGCRAYSLAVKGNPVGEDLLCPIK